MKFPFKKFRIRGYFPDFWHTAKGQRTNKKLCAKMERRRLNRETKENRYE